MANREFSVDFNYQEDEGEGWAYGGCRVEASCESDIESTLLEHYNQVEIIEYREITDDE